MNKLKAVFMIVATILVSVMGGLFGYYIMKQLPPDRNASCGEGVHVTHNNQPLANIAVKEIGPGNYLRGITNSTGYVTLSNICYPVGALISYQGTDYAFQLLPHQIVEARI